MGFALRSGTALIAPLASWIARRATLYAIAGGSVPAASGTTAQATPSRLPPAGRRQPAASPVRPLRAVPPVAARAAAPAATTARPLRMLHIVDGTPQAGTSRLRLSGRMADVCAELDRLAAREAQQAARALRAG